MPKTLIRRSMYRVVRDWILDRFFEIELTSVEREIATESVKLKYAVALRNGFFISLLVIPAILVLDTNIIVSVLIPITMVSGTAWFAISLANVKKKFEKFGLEVTRDLFESFTLSLSILIWLSVFALLQPLWKPALQPWTLEHGSWLFPIAGVLGCFVMLRIIWLIFIGAMKYDINDSMLAGQMEAAEKYYKRSLSVLHVCANHLQAHESLQVANYYIGVSFWEVFSYMKSLGIAAMDKGLTADIENANQLILKPSMVQKEADKVAQGLIRQFLTYAQHIVGQDSKKSYQAIQDELQCLQENTDEDQPMVDTRLAVIFQEIANLLETQGETLFTKSSEQQ